MGDPIPRHHLNKRAAAIAAAMDGPDDQVIRTPDAAAVLGMSVQTIEIWRHKGLGPKYVRLGTRAVGYRLGDLRAWLDERVHQSTSEYA